MSSGFESMQRSSFIFVCGKKRRREMEAMAAPKAVRWP